MLKVGKAKTRIWFAKCWQVATDRTSKWKSLSRIQAGDKLAGVEPNRELDHGVVSIPPMWARRWCWRNLNVRHCAIPERSPRETKLKD